MSKNDKHKKETKQTKRTTKQMGKNAIVERLQSAQRIKTLFSPRIFVFFLFKVKDAVFATVDFRREYL